MSTTSALAAPVLGAGVSVAVLVALVRAPALMLDHPNERSLHDSPIPRTGGVAIVAGSLGSAALFFPDARFLAALAGSIALISAIDDWRSLGILPRLGAHLVAAVLYARYGLSAASALETALLVLGMVWLANLYNFMDGSDGLAAGMAVIGFSAYAVSGWIGGHVMLASLSATVAAATLPFLIVNFHPARLFMGDVGSVTLGFLAAALGSLGWREGAWSALLPVLVFSPFIADATLTLLRRVLRGQRFWTAHREHFYQKLIRMGLGHRNTALAEYAAMLLAAAGGVALLRMDFASQLVLSGAWLGLLLVLGLIIDVRWARHLRQEAQA